VRRLSKLKVLVSGGSGFVGSHLIRSLSRKHEVHNLDITPPKFECDNFLQVDIRDRKALGEAFRTQLRDIDAIIHLAALSRERESEVEQVKYFETNIIGTASVLREACENSRCRKFVFASTYLVYGDSSRSQIQESAPLHPKSIYAITKATGEMICNNFSLAKEFNTVCLRKGLIFGEGDESKRLVELYLSRAKDGLDLQVFGNKVLDFVYVGDVVKAYEKALEPSVNGTFNIGSGSGTPLRDLALLAKQSFHSPSRIIEQPLTSTDVDFYISDNTRMTKELGVHPTLNVQDFIQNRARVVAEVR
jgi:nucleoside-diphosphate-sugar epimerase